MFIQTYQARRAMRDAARDRLVVDNTTERNAKCNTNCHVRENSWTMTPMTELMTELTEMR